MKKAEKNLVHILRSVVCRHAEPLPSDIDWNEQWYLAKRNHLESIVYLAAAEKMKESPQVIPSELYKAMKDKHYQLISRDVNQIHCTEQIERALNASDIHYALQKGSILRFDYPETCMRFMSDLDFYIKPSDRIKIQKCMETIGGSKKGIESGDDQYLYNEKLGIEFHGRLLYKKNESGVIENYPAWEYVDENTNRLTEEGYALNLIGHAIGDLAKGGPGVRYILDLWVYRHFHSPQPDWDIVWNKLKNDKVDEAAKNLLDLSEFLFGEHNNFHNNEANLFDNSIILEMADYVLSGGLHGDARRGRVTEVARAGGKSKAVARQIFRNRKDYENRYTWLIKYPFLLPVAWLLRGISSIKRHRHYMSAWCKEIGSVSRAEANMQQDRMSRWGL